MCLWQALRSACLSIYLHICLFLYLSIYMMDPLARNSLWSLVYWVWMLFRSVLLSYIVPFACKRRWKSTLQNVEKLFYRSNPLTRSSTFHVGAVCDQLDKGLRILPRILCWRSIYLALTNHAGKSHCIDRRQIQVNCRGQSPELLPPKHPECSDSLSRLSGTK